MGSPVELTGSSSSDASIATGLRVVYWLHVSAGSTGGAWSLEDGTDDSGTVKVASSKPASGEDFVMYFHDGLEFKTGIYFDIGGTNVTMTVGYK